MDCGRARAARSCCNLHKLRQPCGLQMDVSRWILATSTGFCLKTGRVLHFFSDGRKQSSSGRFPAAHVSWSVGKSPWSVVTPLISRTQTHTARSYKALRCAAAASRPHDWPRSFERPQTAPCRAWAARASALIELSLLAGQASHTPSTRREAPPRLATAPRIKWTTASAPRRSSRRATSGASRRTSPRSGGTRAGTS